MRLFSLDFSMLLHGTSSSTRGGFVFALSDVNEPVGFALSTKVKKIPIMTSALVGLEKTEVPYYVILFLFFFFKETIPKLTCKPRNVFISSQFDQSQVNRQPCHTKEDILSGKVQSYYDCVLDSIEALFPQCTYRAYMNEPKSKFLRTCAGVIAYCILYCRTRFA